MTPEALEAKLESYDAQFTRLDDQFEGLRMTIDSFLEAQEAKPQNDKLFTALSKAQAEIENAEMDATNPHYGSQYASLDSVLKAVRPALTKHGLCLIQMPRYDTTDKGTVVSLETVLGHTSGQSMTNWFSMYPPKQDPQGIGSCLTYMRRYTVMAICGISGAYDDDAEATNPEAATITPQEADEILNKADELFGDDADDLLQRMCEKLFMVDAVAKIPEGQADLAIRRLENQAKREKSKGEGKSETKSEKKPAPKKPASKPADDDIPVA